MTTTQPTRDIIPTLVQWATEHGPIRVEQIKQLERPVTPSKHDTQP
jgi:hypothetical protein